MTNRPLSVVGTDQEALTTLLRLHAPASPRILDVTHNRGTMWKGLPYRPHRADRDPELHAAGYTDTVADFRALPFEPGSFDVLVFDPPHLTENAGAFSDALTQGGGITWTQAYGTAGEGLGKESIAALFPPFLAEARRVLVPGGVVLAKIADQVHRGAYRWQHVDLIVAAQTAGMTPCDLQLRVALSRGNMIDPKWKHVYHVRQVHTYWLVLRNGASCLSKHAPTVVRATPTGDMFAPALELTA